MSQNSKIEWTQCTWNPVTGCTKISAGCVNCYAEKMAKRLQAMGQRRYRNGFKVTLHPEVLDEPYRWKRPHAIFVNSMSDIFHKAVSYDFISKSFDVMCQASHHRFQVLTKRSSRLLQLNADLPWSENVWMGVTIENNDYVYRADDLRTVNAAVKFLSLEPLLGPLPDLELDEIDWVIVGGESGPGARPMEKRWVLDVKRKCEKENIPFFKQWGGINRKKTGRLLLGKTWDNYPKTAGGKLLLV